jgi:nucleotide-binding universal stress UspA family protein
MTIIAGYHSTPEGRAAVRRAGQEAVLRHSSVVVVGIAADRGRLDELHLPVEVRAVQRELQDAGLELLLEPPSPLDPDDALIQAAQRHGGDLIVVGIRHRSQVGKLLLGSYAQKVILHADCAVLAVKASPDDAVHVTTRAR